MRPKAKWAKIRTYSTRLSRIITILLTICCIIQQNVNEKYFTAKNTVVMQSFATLGTNRGRLRISQNICYVRMTDDKDFLAICGHCGR